MSGPIKVTLCRSIGHARNLYSTAIAFGFFLAASAALFAYNLACAEGARVSLAVVWASSVAPVVPALAAFLAMDAWSAELRSGRIYLLLTSSVLERDFVFGKFLGVYVMTLVAVFTSFVASAAVLGSVSSVISVDAQELLSFLPAFVALALQTMLWTAVSTAMSALTAHAPTAFAASALLTIALPRCGWVAVMRFFGEGSSWFGEMPLDADVIDIASGVLSTSSLVFYFAGTLAALFVTAKAVLRVRCAGRGGRVLRITGAVASFLAIAAACLAVRLAWRYDMTLDLPVANFSTVFSQRTRNVLADSSGEISVTVFLARNDTSFRRIGHLLRSMKRESAALGGARLDLRFVDPRWDIGESERLVRLGAEENSVIFRRGGRKTEVSVGEGLGEQDLASAIRRLTTPPQRRNVYWTYGHGESRFDDYGAFGMSDVARLLAREGYQNSRIDLSSGATVPGDCELIVIAGAKDGFSRIELGRIDAYLKEGGRLLVFLGQNSEVGIGPLLPAWGLRSIVPSFRDAPTLSGSDIIASVFADHPISSPLKGSRVVLERPVAFASSAVAGESSVTERLEFVPLASVGEIAVAAAVERGAAAGSDVAIRPTRMVVIGDPGFPLNLSLSVKANANRDFILNAVAYLSGTDPAGSSDSAADRLLTGLDRNGKMRHLVFSVVVAPVLVFLMMFFVAMRRRHRS